MDIPGLGKFNFHGFSVMETTQDVYLTDPDTRRAITVTLPNPHGFEPPEDDPEYKASVAKAAAALAMHLDDLPVEAVGIVLGTAGDLVSVCTDPALDYTLGTDYFLLEEYQFPPPIAAKTVLRSELTEIRRLQHHVDLVSYPPSLFPSPDNGANRYVFKYNTSSPIALWTEMQMLARLPSHPHLSLLDRLVLDEMTGSKVVGFTMRYIASDTLDKSRPPFKLKWLRQLMQTVDDLNLKHGIIHQDIADRNLLIDPTTDSIILIDFNDAYRVGLARRPGQPEGKWDERDDVKGVLVFLYEYVTRDPSLARYWLHLVEEDDYKDPAKWIKHPDVELDNDVAEFYFELMAWVRRRRAGKQIGHYTEAPQPIDWPHPPAHRVERMEYVVGRQREAGLPYLDWKRPLKAKLDPTRRLLATGRYADEEAAAQTAWKAKAAAATSAGERGRSAMTTALASDVEFGNDKNNNHDGKEDPAPTHRAGCNAAAPDQPGDCPPAPPALSARSEETALKTESSPLRTLRQRHTKAPKRKHEGGSSCPASTVASSAKKNRSARSSPALF